MDSPGGILYFAVASVRPGKILGGSPPEEGAGSEQRWDPQPRFLDFQAIPNPRAYGPSNTRGVI
jgi:hypothetical protein